MAFFPISWPAINGAHSRSRRLVYACPVQAGSRSFLTALVVASLFALTDSTTRDRGQLAHADVDGNRFESSDWGVKLTAPSNWYLSQQTSYPNILLWMYRHKPAGKMLLSAEELDGGLSSRDYADRTAKTLEKLGRKPGFKVGRPQLHAATGAYWIDFDNGNVFLRQALLVSGNIGYSLTLSAKGQRIRQQHIRAFDYALRSIRIDRKRTLDSDK